MSEHFNGTRWKILSVPPPYPDEPNLTPGQSGIDASSSTNAWIVTNGYNGTIDDHWDATTWTQVTSDTPTAAYFQVRGVSVLSDGTAFAVGWFQSTTTSRVRTLAEI